MTQDKKNYGVNSNYSSNKIIHAPISRQESSHDASWGEQHVSEGGAKLFRLDNKDTKACCKTAGMKGNHSPIHLRSAELHYPTPRCHPWECKRLFASRGSWRSPPRTGMRWNCPAEGSHQSASHSLEHLGLDTRCDEMLLEMKRQDDVSVKLVWGVRPPSQKKTQLFFKQWGNIMSLV